MEQAPIPRDFRQKIEALLGQLDPTPTAEWVTAETDRIMQGIEAAPPANFAKPS